MEKFRSLLFRREVMFFLECLMNCDQSVHVTWTCIVGPSFERFVLVPTRVGKHLTRSTHSRLSPRPTNLKTRRSRSLSTSSHSFNTTLHQQLARGFLAALCSAPEAVGAIPELDGPLESCSELAGRRLFSGFCLSPGPAIRRPRKSII